MISVSHESGEDVVVGRFRRGREELKRRLGLAEEMEEGEGEERSSEVLGSSFAGMAVLAVIVVEV